MKKTGLLNNSLLWFGASVSIAEIMTGALIAPLGMQRGIAAILIGHMIGGALFFLAGLIGAKTGLGAMESTAISFGKSGSGVFSLLNVLQLVGWTAVMIIGASRALSVIADPVLGFEGGRIYSLAIGGLIVIWIALGIENLGMANSIAAGALLVLVGVLSFVVFKGSGAAPAAGEMSFGAAVELSAAMPLSWLPLVSDYVKEAKRPGAANVVGSVTYFAGSSWMYIIGLASAVYIGSADIALIFSAAGLGVAGIIVIILSTVTTTFLDAYSVGISAVNIFPKAGAKIFGIAATVIGTVLALTVSMEKYESFLYLIGSAFTPMITILMTDFFILKNDSRKLKFDLKNLCIWVVGFVVYRVFMNLDFPVGTALPSVVAISILTIIINKGVNLCLKKSSKA